MNTMKNTRNASADNWDDMKLCMDMVRKLHEAGLKVGHSFDIRERISFYEKLCLEHGGIPFEDYSQVREWVNRLLDALDKEASTMFVPILTQMWITS